MAIYYVNGYGTAATAPFDGTPYTTPESGAPNVSTLLTDLNGTITDGDEIHIADGNIIDNTSSIIELNNRLKIRNISNNDIPIHLNDSGTGIIDNVGCSYYNLHLHKTNMFNSTHAETKASATKYYKCSFTFDTGQGACIYINQVDGTVIDGCSFDVSDGAISYGIYGLNCNYTIIKNSNMGFYGTSPHGTGIALLATSGEDLSHNVITRNVLSDTDTVTILMSNAGSHNTISYNSISFGGTNMKSIQFIPNTTATENININNNVINFGTPTHENSSAIYVPEVPSNDSVEINIYNNIFYRNSDDNESVAIEASIPNGIVDYNNFYNIKENNKFVTNGSVGIISELGPKNIEVDPRLIWHTLTNNPYSSNDVRHFYCDIDSECVGAGMAHDHMGIGAYRLNNNGDFLNIVDTVTDNMGRITIDSGRFAPTFFNNVLSESSLDYSEWYRRGNEPYQSEVYKNQWEYEQKNPSTFPFEENDHFYRKSFIYVLQNKKLLQPFDGIHCPANPGYGYDLGYPGYKNGLWGYPRIEYKNNCFPEPCIIQDSYIDENIIDDTTSDVEFWILDKIDPDCDSFTDTEGDSDEYTLFATFYGENLPDSPYTNDIRLDYNSKDSGIYLIPIPNPTTIRKVEVEISGYTGEEGLLVRSVHAYDRVKSYHTVSTDTEDPTPMFDGITTIVYDDLFDETDEQLFGSDIIGDRNGTGNIIVRWYI